MRKGMCMKSNDQPKETIHKQTHGNVSPLLQENTHFLSNFYPAPVTYMGQTYANNEARFPGAEDLLCKRAAAILYFPPAQSGRSKKRGKKLTLRPDWDKVKISLMYEICMCKFMQNPKLRDALPCHRKQCS